MEERRELSTADLANTAEAHDRPLTEEARARAQRPDDTVGAEHRATAEPVAEKVRESSRAMLFPNEEAERMRSEWTDIQAAFVDAPRDAVQRADQLVAGTMKRIAEVFAGERHNLEQQWDRGGDVTTEDLRVALQRYRAFFDRLLTL